MVKWKGLNKMKADLKRQSSRADKKLDEAIQDIGMMLNEEITTAAVFEKGYSTGNLRREIYYARLGQAKAEVVSPAHYSGYLEHGTRFMEAQPFFHNTITKQHADIMEILEEKTR